MPNPSRSSLILPMTIACAMVMEGIDSTVIATSLPVIAQDIHESPIALKLAVYVQHERQTETPLLSFKFLRGMTYRTSVLGNRA